MDKRAGLLFGLAMAAGLAVPALAEPDYWKVAGVPANDVLNLRAGPSAGHRIVGGLANGDVVRNLGCRATNGSRWCRVALLDDMGGTGWANGRYLRESAPPQGAGNEDGGPVYWKVVGVGANDVLNIRSGPSTGNPVIGGLANGDVVQNLGCRRQNGSRWCRIALLDDMGGTGWVNGGYLRESGSPR